MNNNLLQVEIKFVYGQRTIYPHNARAKEFCKLLGRKTFTQTDINQLKAMDFSFEVVLADNLCEV